MINPPDDVEPSGSCGPDVPIGCTYETKKFASDETVLLVAVGGGVVIGYLAQRKFAHALWPRARVGLAPNGRGISVSIPAGW